MEARKKEGITCQNTDEELPNRVQVIRDSGENLFTCKFKLDKAWEGSTEPFPVFEQTLLIHLGIAPPGGEWKANVWYRVRGKVDIHLVGPTEQGGHHA